MRASSPSLTASCGAPTTRTSPRPLDPVGKTDAEVAAFLARLRLASGKVAPPCRLQDVTLARGIIAAVVLHGGAGARLERFGVRHLLRRDEIAAARLRAIEA